MSVLQGLKVLQVGPGLGAAVCGRLFADVGADVNCFKPGRDTPLAEHLNNGKLADGIAGKHGYCCPRWRTGGLG